MEKKIVEYVKKTKKYINLEKASVTPINEKEGIFVAGILPGNPQKIGIGFTRLHKNDDWDVDPKTKEYKRDFGRDLATKRAIEWANNNVINVPDSIQKQLNKFVERCERYYKDKQLPNWVK